MISFNDIVINEEEETVEIGAGLTWTEVYSHLIPKGINVVGGRINGVGVAGLTLGGGSCSSSLSHMHSIRSTISLVWQDLLGTPISLVSR